MKLFISPSAGRLFKLFLFITLGMPVLAILLLFIIALAGFPGAAFMCGLYINHAFFTPVRFVFGNNVVPIQEFGPDPGAGGFVAAIILYVALCYFLANAVGAFIGGKKNAS